MDRSNRSFPDLFYVGWKFGVLKTAVDRLNSTAKSKADVTPPITVRSYFTMYYKASIPLQVLGYGLLVSTVMLFIFIFYLLCIEARDRYRRIQKARNMKSEGCPELLGASEIA